MSDSSSADFSQPRKKFKPYVSGVPPCPKTNECSFSSISSRHHTTSRQPTSTPHSAHKERLQQQRWQLLRQLRKQGHRSHIERPRLLRQPQPWPKHRTAANRLPGRPPRRLLHLGTAGPGHIWQHGSHGPLVHLWQRSGWRGQQRCWRS